MMAIAQELAPQRLIRRYFRSPKDAREANSIRLVGVISLLLFI
jgi:hypothetical protein